MEETVFLFLDSNSCHRPWLSLSPSSSLRATGEMGLSGRGKPVWRRRKENSLHLHPTPRAVKGNTEPYLLAF